MILKVFEHLRRRDASGRSHNHRVVISYEERGLMDEADKILSNMPRDARAYSEQVGPFRFMVKKD